MSETRGYAGPGSRPYRSRVSTYWWLWQWPYMKFILRELSSVAVAFFVVITLLQIRAVRQGPRAYAEFQEWLRTPLLIALDTICFLFVLFHTITWFNLAPRAMVIRIRGKRVPDTLIRAANYGAWLAVSGMMAWLILKG